VSRHVGVLVVPRRIFSVLERGNMAGDKLGTPFASLGDLKGGGGSQREEREGRSESSDEDQRSCVE
jgi:hypothetical protein